jgi:hypothetical protein
MGKGGYRVNGLFIENPGKEKEFGISNPDASPPDINLNGKFDNRIVLKGNIR